jgi:drug/metabolite transporter (DMT)-like permease
VPAGLTDSAELAPEVAPADAHQAAAADSPAKAWLVIIAQLVGGAVAGAVLWVGFRYLWGKMPPLALGAAVLATAGSVLLVRAIRRSDDLRTSLLAVLVGLVVTVSPAVLVLVNR